MVRGCPPRAWGFSIFRVVFGPASYFNYPNGVLAEAANNIIFAVEELSRTNSLGLVGMRERAILCGGELTIHGTPGKGTTVILKKTGKPSGPTTIATARSRPFSPMPEG
jgi:hypothetical protein